MGRIIVVDGAFETGKSTLLETINTYPPSMAGFVPKFVYNWPADREVLDDLNKWVGNENEFMQMYRDHVAYYSYALIEQKYVIPRSHLDEKILQTDNTFVVVRSAECIKRLKRDYPSVIAIFLDMDIELVQRELEKRTISSVDHDYYISRFKAGRCDYLDNPTLYDEVWQFRGEIQGLRDRVDAIIRRND